MRLVDYNEVDRPYGDRDEVYRFSTPSPPDPRHEAKSS
jgi:hypothetical protein